MKFENFQLLVAQHEDLFHGVQPETLTSLREAEQQLGLSLPITMKWLLSKYGYSTPCGIDALDETVTRTLEARQALGLPARYVIINDFSDGGIVYFDAETSSDDYKVYWVGAHNFMRLVTKEPMDDDFDVFTSFAEWVQYRLEEELAKNY